MRILPFAPGDVAGLYRVCLLTGDAGTDASDRYRDPDLLGHVYAGPYPAADPALTWVVRDDEGVAGYVVGTADSAAFAAWQERAWWPSLRERYPLPDPEVPGEDAAGRRDVELVRAIHERTAPDAELLATHPAHLHIDLLPRAQGHGLGRTLIATLADALRARGVPGVHLGVSEANAGAIAFYGRVGFATLSRQEWGRTLGMDLRA